MLHCRQCQRQCEDVWPSSHTFDMHMKPYELWDEYLHDGLWLFATLLHKKICKTNKLSKRSQTPETKHRPRTANVSNDLLRMTIVSQTSHKIWRAKMFHSPHASNLGSRYIKFRWVTSGSWITEIPAILIQIRKTNHLRQMRRLSMRNVACNNTEISTYRYYDPPRPE